MKLAGNRRDGTAFTVNVTSRTSRVRLYQERDVASLDLAGMGAAVGLAIFEAGSEPIRYTHLEEMSALPALTNLSLSVDDTTDVAVLKGALALEHLDLTLTGRDAFDTSWLARMKSLRSLSLSFHGSRPTIDLSALARLTSLSLSGVGNEELDLPPSLESFYIDHSPKLDRLGGPALAKLRTFNLIDCASLREVDTEPFRGGPIEVIRLADVPELSVFRFIPLGHAPALRSLTLTGHAMAFLDLTPLAKVASLKSLMVDGKEMPFVDEGPIASPALKAWAAQGGVRREL